MDPSDPTTMPPAHAASFVNAGGYFDCNICLDFAVDPVVTLCGHLYCWPCIHKWLQLEEGTYPQTCPVCKASLSEDSLVPLYGRGKPAEPHHRRPSVPCRPALPRDHAPAHPRAPAGRRQHQHGFGSGGGDSLTSPAVWGSPLLMAVALLPWAFRGHEAPAFAGGLYYSSPYRQAGLGGESPWLRRQEMQIEKTLSQLWGFLFICALLCFLLS